MNDNKKVQGIDSKIWELSDEIVLPINVLIYLANDRAYNNPQRLSKIQAFVDLVEHYLDSLQNEQDAALNIAKLSRRWNWTRPTVIAYVNNLKAMNAFEVKDSKDRNVSFVGRNIVTVGSAFSCDIAVGDIYSHGMCRAVRSKPAVRTSCCHQ